LELDGREVGGFFFIGVRLSKFKSEAPLPKAELDLPPRLASSARLEGLTKRGEDQAVVSFFHFTDWEIRVLAVECAFVHAPDIFEAGVPESPLEHFQIVEIAVLALVVKVVIDAVLHGKAGFLAMGPVALAALVDGGTAILTITPANDFQIGTTEPDSSAGLENPVQFPKQIL
jgi:hypothetical protein